MNVAKERNDVPDQFQSTPGPPTSQANEAKVLVESQLPLQTSTASFTTSLDEDRSFYSADNSNERWRGRLLAPSILRYRSTSPAPNESWRARCHALWFAHRGPLCVLGSQLFGALMNVTARLLETSGAPLNTIQVMFVRMSITVVLSTLYMWWTNVRDFPFGPREVRGLLLARGFGGFFGLLGIYYSLAYLPLAEATVITFLAPVVACWACSILLHQPFTRKEQVACFVSLLGVVLIARPTSFFSVHAGDTPIASGASDAFPSTNVTVPASADGVDNVTSAQRLTAIGVALIGVLGAACAYTTIRWIGQRAHPLISINYFAAWVTFVTTMILLFVPGMDFKLPSGLRQWTYLIFLGLCGFLLQVLLTAGLSYEKSSRATNMIYTQMLFALAFDKLVFDTTPSALSIFGSSLILGSALYIAIQQDPSRKPPNKETAGTDEEIGLITANDVEIDEQQGRNSLQEFQLHSRRTES
ncbi:MAG: hypothetical protein LQ350_003040 [Teloschistes chrysophthalmus]|nr:MAG: hypothetical protein LQ350_003040 [Niorma chrysophthalma]